MGRPQLLHVDKQPSAKMVAWPDRDIGAVGQDEFGGNQCLERQNLIPQTGVQAIPNGYQSFVIVARR